MNGCGVNLIIRIAVDDVVIRDFACDRVYATMLIYLEGCIYLDIYVLCCCIKLHFFALFLMDVQPVCYAILFAYLWAFGTIHVVNIYTISVIILGPV